MLVKSGYKKFRHSTIIVGQIINAFRSPRRILSITFQKNRNSRSIILVFFLGYFLAAIFLFFFLFFFCYLLSLEKSHRRDVPPRKLNSSNERRRAGVIEKTSCEIGKAFLSLVSFFLEDHWSIRSR